MADAKRTSSLAALTALSVGATVGLFVALSIDEASGDVSTRATSTERPTARIVKAKRRVPIAITRSSR